MDDQLQLIPVEQLPDEFFSPDRGGHQGESTGEVVLRRSPETYKLVMTMLANGIGILRIAHVTGLHPCTIMAIRDRNGEGVEILKKAIARLARFGAQLCVEGVIEVLADPIKRSKIPARDLGILHGIFCEKSEFMDGGATARIEFVPGSVPSLEDFNKLIDRVAAARTIEAEAVEMGRADEAAAQKGEEPGAGVDPRGDEEAGPALGEERRGDDGGAPGAGPAGGSV
jgi:hypothetical protein